MGWRLGLRRGIRGALLDPRRGGVVGLWNLRGRRLGGTAVVVVVWWVWMLVAFSAVGLGRGERDVLLRGRSPVNLLVGE